MPRIGLRDKRACDAGGALGPARPDSLSGTRRRWAGCDAILAYSERTYTSSFRSERGRGEVTTQP